jgi:hypothetical protein
MIPTNDRVQRNGFSDRLTSGSVESARVAQARRAVAARLARSHPNWDGHPATSEKIYSPREVEFLAAIEAWKRAKGRKFPTWCEVLAVLESLGYTKDFPEHVFDRPDSPQ